ncbi:MAG: class I SAM-dependent rRNA methyltransferase [Pirellulaceae bacterium]|nr:class I SAM-dependent rRNA methyltransferase [Pirellulaceae bacterium]
MVSLQAGAQSHALAIQANAQLAAVILDKPTTHPNVFRKRIRNIEGSPRRGDWVAVYHTHEVAEPELFAYGLYNPKSEIALRIVRWGQLVPDNDYWDQCLENALALRCDVLKLDSTTDSYRVLHGEADGVPGLVIDRYADVLSAEVFSLAMGSRAQAILERLGARLGTKHWLIQPSPQLASQEGATFKPWGSANLPSQVTITEHGTRYRVHFGTGHKTGFFCDQRENRLRVAELCGGKSVLDVCCYTGGFAVMAAKRGGASEVTGIDLDEAPLEQAKQNAALNDVRVKFTQADAFAYMRDMLRAGKQYDMVVLDPPKLIRSRAEIEEGSKKHFDLNRLAMQLVRPGGLMLTCTCAGLLPEEEFIRLVRSAARSSTRSAESPHALPRPMQILARTGAAACHPVSGNCPEAEYLNAMWLRLG